MHVQFLGERFQHYVNGFKSRSVGLQTLSPCNFPLHLIVSVVTLLKCALKRPLRQIRLELREAQCLERRAPAGEVPSFTVVRTRGSEKSRGSGAWTASGITLWCKVLALFACSRPVSSSLHPASLNLASITRPSLDRLLQCIAPLCLDFPIWWRCSILNILHR